MDTDNRTPIEQLAAAQAGIARVALRVGEAAANSEHDRLVAALKLAYARALADPETRIPTTLHIAISALVGIMDFPPENDHASK